MVVDNPCATCSGSGRARAARPVSARIPAGVTDGARIRLKGKGASGENGGPPGDLFIVVHVSADPVFGRTGDNVTITVPVTYAEAALGAELPVPLPRGGKVTLKIPPGTANGRTFRIRGRGAGRRDGTVGDLLATVDVAVPHNLSDSARAALAAYVEAAGEPDPRADLMAAAAARPGARTTSRDGGG
jgi:molecular chaperone DnaJ